MLLTIYEMPTWFIIFAVCWLIIGLYSFFVQVQTLKKLCYVKFNEVFWHTEDYKDIKYLFWFLPLVYIGVGILMLLLIYLENPKYFTLKYYKIPHLKEVTSN